jgi:hypothetical protein
MLTGKGDLREGEGVGTWKIGSKNTDKGGKKLYEEDKEVSGSI